MIHLGSGVQSGHEVWAWPEFKALAARLGIETSDMTQRLTIDMPWNGLVTVSTVVAVQDREALVRTAKA